MENHEIGEGNGSGSTMTSEARSTDHVPFGTKPSPRSGHGGRAGLAADLSASREKSVKHGVFIVLVISVIVVVALVFRYSSYIADNILPVAAALIIIYLLARFDFLLRLTEYERAVIMRFGKVNRVGGPGWALLLPPIESYKVVDLRAKTLDIPPQEVITKDNIKVKVDAVIYMKVNEDDQSVINSIVEVEDYSNAARLFVVGLIRNQAGTRTFDELLTGVDSLNEYLKKELEGISKRWGVTVEGATITDIHPPHEFQAAREEKQIAAQKKLARMESAEAHKAEIEAVKQAAEQMGDKALAYYYVKALEKLGEGQSSKIIFPMELTELAKAIGGRKGLAEADTEAFFRKYAPALKELFEKPAGGKSAGRKRRAKKRKKGKK